MEELRTAINQAKAIIFDSDGVLVEEGSPLPGARELIQRLKEYGKQCVVLSNNSTKHPDEMLSHYQKNGLLIDFVINSGILAVEYCKKENINSVFVIGEHGLINLLEESGIEHNENAEDAVIVGMDRTLTYNKLAIATRLIRNGRRFIATNPDKSFPTPRGLEPGAGSMIAALIASTDREPEIVLGKPDIFGFNFVLNKLQLTREDVVMIGDRYETDIIGAVNAGIYSIVVNTGVATNRKNPNKWDSYPEVSLTESLMNLLDSLYK